MNICKESEKIMKNAKKNPDKIIAFAICLYEADGYPENSFEMLDYVLSHKYCLKAERLMREGYTQAEPKQFESREKWIIKELETLVLKSINVSKLSAFEVGFQFKKDVCNILNQLDSAQTVTEELKGEL